MLYLVTVIINLLKIVMQQYNYPKLNKENISFAAVITDLIGSYLTTFVYIWVNRTVSNFGEKALWTQSWPLNHNASLIRWIVSPLVDPDQTVAKEAIWSGSHRLHIPFSKKPWCIKF